MTRAKWLYIPIEIKVRELHSKVLLAAEAAARGYTVVLGRKSELSAFSLALPKGIYIGFGAHKNFYEQYKVLKKRGTVNVIMDEEGLVTFSPEMFQRTRLSHETLSQINTSIAWGAYQKAMVRDYLDVDSTTKVFAAGNPRFDILSPKFNNVLSDDVVAIKNKYRKYIMIVSSFGSCNHFIGKEGYLKSLRDKKVVQSDADEQFFKSYFELKENNLSKYMETIPKIAENYADYDFIIRPHPSENRSLWDKLAEDHNNIHVESNGNIQSWLIGSTAIIHHFCTTAIEAYVADIPSIALRFEASELLESELPYRCSYSADSLETLCTALDDITLNNARGLKEKRKKNERFYADYISNYPKADAHEKIINCCEDVAVYSKEGFRLWVLRLKLFIKKIIRSESSKSETAYIDHKFDQLALDEVRQIISKLSQSKGIFANLKVKKLGSYSCVISRSRNYRES
jgi:surface carbohydrate biosynthesis protein